MVRIPASWARAGFTRPTGSQPRRGVSARRVPSPGPEMYVRAVTVDLGNDGVAPQVTFPGFLALTGGPVTSPGVTTNILTATVPAGRYLVAWTVTLAGTVGGADVNNFALYNGGAFVTSSVNTGTVGSFVQAPVLLNVPAGSLNLKILTNGAGTAGSQYSAAIAQNPGLPGTVQAFVGPSSGGDLWSLDQCFLSTSVGQLDAAQCVVYVGALPVPQAAVTGSLAGGGSQFGLGGVGVPFGWFVFAVWSGGTPGATAYLRVTGAKTVLTN